MTITLADLEAAHIVHAAHLDGPRGRNGWFGDMHRCVQYPRLQRRVRYFRKDRSHDVTWYVDGQEVGKALADALPLLNVPPELTDEEKRVLDMVTDDFVDLRRQGITVELLMLQNKGLIEFAEGKCRRRAP
jgi:hypothetical protein